MKYILLFFTFYFAVLQAQDDSGRLISGVFSISQQNYYNPNSTQLEVNRAVSAYFTYTPALNIKTTDFQKAGNVKFNNNPLQYDNSKKHYTENTTPNITTQNWKVSGHAGIIPNMNFNYNGTLPSFNVSTNIISTTIKKTDTLFITLNNIQNADSICVTINDDNNSSNKHYVVFQAPNYSNNF